GPDARVKVDLTHQEVRRGDILVLCSDGLSGQVKKEEIAEIVTRAGDLQPAADRLIALANERGGPDHLTVILARFYGAVAPPGTRSYRARASDRSKPSAKPTSGWVATRSPTSGSIRSGTWTCHRATPPSSGRGRRSWCATSAARTGPS